MAGSPRQPFQNFQDIDAWRSNDMDPWRRAVHGWQQGVNTWKTGVNTFQKDVNKWHSRFDADVEELPDFKRATRDRLAMLQRTQKDREDHLAVLESWRQAADTQVESLFKSKVNIKTYNEDKDKWNNDLKAIAGRADTLETYAAAIKPMENRLGSLEGRTRELESKVASHDGKTRGFEGEFKGFGKRIDHVDKRIGEIKAALSKTPDPPEPQRPTVPPTGGNQLGLNTAEHHFITASPGGILVSNYGQLSVQHSSSYVNTTQEAIFCPCQTQSSEIGPVIIPPPQNPSPGIVASSLQWTFL